MLSIDLDENLQLAPARSHDTLVGKALRPPLFPGVRSTKVSVQHWGPRRAIATSKPPSIPLPLKNNIQESFLKSSDSGPLDFTFTNSDAAFVRRDSGLSDTTLSLDSVYPSDDEDDERDSTSIPFPLAKSISGGMVGSPPSSPMQVDHVPEGRTVFDQSSITAPPVKMRRTFSDGNNLCAPKATNARANSSSGWEKTITTMCEADEHSPLPYFTTPHDAVRRITSETPYEFEGGHVKGAFNVCKPADIETMFFPSAQMTDRDSSIVVGERTVIVMHCEFSVQRAPRMALHLRNYDRKLNANDYPKMDFPHLYVLDGGYKAFFEKSQNLCIPPAYIPMNDENYRSEYKKYNAIWKYERCYSTGFLRT
ncbi:cell division cycle- protein [Chytridiales sp. JEL 0842]|nr:cell division cycle- protein [Chytridiales sp. JEL 0842]